MPIYAYRCEECGFAKDVLQKISDPQLTVCLACGKPSFKKQLTAAGFQLKGTGWYATDFRGGAAAPKDKDGASAPSEAAAPAATDGSGSASATLAPASATSTSATSTSAAAPAAAGTTRAAG